MTQSTNRRDFLKQSAAVGATAWWFGTQSLAAQEKSPLERLNIACVGVGGKGNSDTNGLAKYGNVIGLCDVDETAAKKQGIRHKKAKQYSDYREMYDDIGDEIDVVSVSTPDHSHAPAALPAMRMGKHVYVQKPLTWSVEEARVMREVAAKEGIVTQMGNQGTADDGMRTSVEVLRSGAIGDVSEVHIWTNRPIWPQGTGRPKGSDPVPPNLHWDLFLGPAPERPYKNGVYTPFKWRGWLDFGTGALGDMACHTANMPVMALNLFDPTSVVAETAGIVENETYPAWSIITFQFPEKDGRGPVKVVWYDGGKLPPKELLEGESPSGSGCVVVGSKGKMYSRDDYGRTRIMLPKDEFADYKEPEKTLPRTNGHYEEFMMAAKAGDPKMTMSNFDYAGRLTETILLGNVAMRAGQKIEWDAKNMKVTNMDDGGESLIRRKYREGFDIAQYQEA
ncbi:Gfo/Idh/MocA family oxidoreductase [Thalassoroseus pseudoceratinae]|uniref:Gfo/Idh/MocA family oxidoreductase n=1 Tax=Thalassoroseus pseudoceratinae TaxID=2713176 RepID=UPI001423DD8C|nr:Gfo/Idh/MocA family oxidoreductase [Thalassoroseus pseudoceratinae]